MLYSSLYHHQKVRCSEAMFKRLCKLALEGGLLKNGLLKIDHPTDFLKYVDSDFLDFSAVSSSFKKGKPRELARRLSQRKLMKRALIISRPFIEGIEEHENVKASFKKLLNDCQNEEMKLRSKIVKEANKLRKKESGSVPKIDVDHLIIDVPKKVEMEESLDTIVPFDTGIGGITKVEIDDVFPIRKWAEGYNAVKWRIHIFCYPKCQDSVNKASRNVLLGAPYNILLAKTATSLCKIKYSMLEEETQRKLDLEYE